MVLTESVKTVLPDYFELLRDSMALAKAADLAIQAQVWIHSTPSLSKNLQLVFEGYILHEVEQTIRLYELQQSLGLNNLSDNCPYEFWQSSVNTTLTLPLEEQETNTTSTCDNTSNATTSPFEQQKTTPEDDIDSKKDNQDARSENDNQVVDIAHKLDELDVGECESKGMQEEKEEEEEEEEQEEKEQEDQEEEKDQEDQEQEEEEEEEEEEEQDQEEEEDQEEQDQEEEDQDEQDQEEEEEEEEEEEDQEQDQEEEEDQEEDQEEEEEEEDGNQVIRLVWTFWFVVCVAMWLRFAATLFVLIADQNMLDETRIEL